jgi:hypothetical protein
LFEINRDRIAGRKGLLESFIQEFVEMRGCPLSAQRTLWFHALLLSLWILPKGVRKYIARCDWLAGRSCLLR